MAFERLGHTAARALASASACMRASTSCVSGAARSTMLATTSTSSALTSPFAAFGARASATPNASRTITVMVERGDADRAYKRLRRIMVSEGIYQDFRASTEGHKKPSELRVIARKERERRSYRSKLNSKLGWIMRRKERGF